MFTWFLTYVCPILGRRTATGTVVSRKLARVILLAWLRGLPKQGVRVISAGVVPAGKDSGE